MGLELEKFAATMQQLQRAARRIGAITPLQAGQIAVRDPATPKILTEKPRDIARLEKVLQDPKQRQDFAKDFAAGQGAGLCHTTAQQRAVDARHKQNVSGDIPTLRGQIIMPPKSSPQWKNLGQFAGLPKKERRYAHDPKVTIAPPLRNPEGLKTLIHLHEGFERVNPPKEYLPIRSHYSPRVLMNENNMLAGLRGPQSVDPKSRMLGLRGATGESQGMEKLVEKAYGGRFPYEFGQTKLPKAMRKNLMQRLLEKEVRLPRELKPQETGKTAAALHYGLGAVAGGIGAVALQLLLDRDLRNELLTPHVPATAPIHPQVIRDAAKIAPLLKHLNPEKSRIAIGALPGTGKSQLASELAKRLGMQHHDADMFLGKAPIPPGSIAERYDMLVNEDPEQFDALMHLKRPGSGRGDATASLLNLPAIDAANTQQFAAARGKALHPTDTAWLKLKPEGGFGTKNLDQGFINKSQLAKKLAPGLLGMVAGAIATHLLKK